MGFTGPFSAPKHSAFVDQHQPRAAIKQPRAAVKQPRFTQAAPNLRAPSVDEMVRQRHALLEKERRMRATQMADTTNDSFEEEPEEEPEHGWKVPADDCREAELIDQVVNWQYRKGEVWGAYKVHQP